MGHYASEMGYDRETSEQEAYRKKKREMEERLCKALNVTRGELKLVYKVLKESWNISDSSR